MSREVAIVTGGARGLGAAYVEGLKGAGFDVVVADLSESDVGDLYVRVDVSDPASTEAMANGGRRALRAHRRPDQQRRLLHADRQEAVRGADGRGVGPAFAVNVRGTWLCCRAVAPTMKAQRSGKIVNTSSMTVPSGIPGFLHYVSSKSAIVGLTRALARELGEWGIS